MATVLLVAALNGLFYGLTIPPWDLYDEDAHLAYALTVRDERRIPNLEEYTRRDVVDSAIETDRWERFRLGRPDTSSLDAMGLGGRLYQGYQPPLYYLLILPATAIAPNDVLTTMYLARLALGPALLVLLTWTTWALARAWFPNAGETCASVGALIVAVMPTAGAAAGRVNNDLLAATLIAAGALAATLYARDPGIRRAIVLGVVSSLAVLAKAHGMLLLPVVVVALLIAWRQLGFALRPAFIALGLPVLTAGAWTLWTHSRYGVWTGSTAFLDFSSPFEPMSTGVFLRAFLFNSWSGYWLSYEGGWLRIATGLVLLLVAAVGLFGLRRLCVPIEALTFSAILVIGFVLMLWYGNVSGLVYPQGRILLPLFPLGSALVAAGWTGLGGRWVPMVPGIVAVVLSISFILGWYLPFFYG